MTFLHGGVDHFYGYEIDELLVFFAIISHIDELLMESSCRALSSAFDGYILETNESHMLCALFFSLSSGYGTTEASIVSVCANVGSKCKTLLSFDIVS